MEKHPQKKAKQGKIQSINKKCVGYNRFEIGYLNLVGGRRRSEIFSNGSFWHCFSDVINTKKLIKNQVM